MKKIYLIIAIFFYIFLYFNFNGWFKRDVYGGLCASCTKNDCCDTKCSSNEECKIHSSGQQTWCVCESVLPPTPTPTLTPAQRPTPTLTPAPGCNFGACGAGGCGSCERYVSGNCSGYDWFRGDRCYYDENCSSSCTTAPTPTPTPIPVPNCKDLKINNKPGSATVVLGDEVNLSAVYENAAGPVTGRGLAIHDSNCSSYVFYKTIAGGQGTVNFSWTPTSTGTFTADCRAWNDGIAECRGRCVDHPPRYQCAGSDGHGGGSYTTITVITPTPTPTPTVCGTRAKGDANCDGKIDGRDYSMWLNRQCTSGCQPENLKADFNNDSQVNDDDYSIWFNNRQ